MTLLLLAAGLAGPAACAAVAWRDVLEQPAGWYASDEAHAIADTVLTYQTGPGGWVKNRDMTRSPAETLPVGELDEAVATHPTIDNGATTTQLHFLARVQAARPDPRYLAAIGRGVDYLLAAQYPNGGWPQFYPLRAGYYTHITFNDDAMVNVLNVLRDVERAQPPYALLGAERRARATAAIERGIACILRCQIVVDRRRTAWCAQHDESTFAPAKARKYEHPSLSGFESVGLVRFLMGIEHPSPEIIAAIQGAVAWFDQVKLTGLRQEFIPDPTLPHGADKRVVADPSAPPLWARFYEIGTNRPIFGGRDGVIHYALTEVEPERRAGYRWYIDDPKKLLNQDYPHWKKKWLPAPPRAG